jgi:hypothetical protein
MFVPITDDRLHTLGVDENKLHEVPFYEDCEYEQAYPILNRLLPEMFSVNLKGPIEQFLAKIPPTFGVTVHEVIDLACYYYSDWDSVVAVTDEFIHVGALQEIRKNMVLAHYDTVTAEAEIQRCIDMLSEAVRELINIVVGMLSRNNVPAIMDFGSSYKLARIDDFGNAYFSMATPSAVYDAVENQQSIVPANRCAGPGDF